VKALLSVAFWVAVILSAVHPVNAKDYVLEIAVPVAGFVLLLATYKRFAFTPLSYVLMFAEALVLVVGAHYTHERVPLFEWLKPVLGWQRNHYDRFAHFCVGLLLVVPVRELLVRLTPLRGRWLAALSAISILAFAGFYEITEWWTAVLASPETAEAYLGSQGDPWDAQKDMLFDTLGALAGLLLFTRVHDRALGYSNTTVRLP
jgi:putative membrane protein